MRSDLRPKTFNVLLFVTGIILIVISYPRAFNPVETSLGAGINSIGSITSIQNDARLKKSHLFNWSAGSSGDPLAAGDLVFTNSNSYAEIKFGQGHQLELDSETLLKIKDKEIEVRNGSVDLAIGKAQGAINIKVGGESYTLSGKANSTKVSISSNAGKSKFLVSEGDVNIKGRGIDVDAKKGQEITATPQGLSKSNLSIELLYPVNESLLLGPNDKIQFKVKGAPADSFAIVTSSESQRKLPLNSDLQLPPGQYIWAVANDREKLTLEKAFDLKLKTAPPALVSPENLATLYTYEDDSLIQFKWKASESSSRLRAYDSTGKLVLSKGGLSSDHIERLRHEGTYTWQVRIEEQGKESKWSAPRRFVLVKKEHHHGEALVIELERPDQLAKFDWSDSEAGDRFLLSKRPDFSTIIKEKVINKQTSIQTIVPEVGVYYWKLIKKNGIPSQATPRRVLVRPTPAPTKPKAPPSIRLRLKNKSSSIFQKVLRSLSPVQSAYASEFEETLVKFDQIDRAKIYEIEIYSDKALSNRIFKLQTSEPKFKWRPKRAGQFYWRIRFMDHWDRWSPYSDASRLMLTYGQIKNHKTAKKSQSKIAKASAVDDLNSKVEFGYAPSSISFQQDGEENYEIKGQALGGHGLGVSYQRYGLDYRSSYGRVFDEKTFYDRSVKAFARFNLQGLHLGPSLMLGQVQSYKSENSQAQEGPAIMYYGVGARIMKEFSLTKFLDLGLGAAIHVLGANAYSIFLKLSYRWDHNMGVGLYLEGERSALKNGDEELDIQSLRTFFGPHYKF